MNHQHHKIQVYYLDKYFFWLVLILGSGSFRILVRNGSTKTRKFKTCWGERIPRGVVKRVKIKG